MANYNNFHLYHCQGGQKGLSILVRKDIYVEPLHIPNSCGLYVESLGVSITLQDTKLQIINIYRPPRDSATLRLDHIFAAISNSLFIGDDFNVHNPVWNNPSTSNAHRACSS